MRVGARGHKYGDRAARAGQNLADHIAEHGGGGNDVNRTGSRCCGRLRGT